MSRPLGSLSIIEACTHHCCPARNILKQEKRKSASMVPDRRPIATLARKLQKKRKFRDSGLGVWGQGALSAVLGWPVRQTKTQAPFGLLQLCELAVCPLNCNQPSMTSSGVEIG